MQEEENTNDNTHAVVFTNILQMLEVKELRKVLEVFFLKKLIYMSDMRVNILRLVMFLEIKIKFVSLH